MVDVPHEVSAQVLLRSRSGRVITGDTVITSANIAEFQPSDDDAREATSTFRRAGFATGPLVGISFSITAPVATFESVFDVRIRADAGGEMAVSRGATDHGYALPVDHLPAALKGIVTAVEFSPPADLYLDR